MCCNRFRVNLLLPVHWKNLDTRVLCLNNRSWSSASARFTHSFKVSSLVKARDEPNLLLTRSKTADHVVFVYLLNGCPERRSNVRSSSPGLGFLADGAELVAFLRIRDSVQLAVMTETGGCQPKPYTN